MLTTVSRRAVIYCRQSRDSTGEGAAVERQETASRGLCAAREWPVVAVVTDNDVSASTGRVRPGWQRVLGMIEAGEVDVVVAWHLDRITRTMRDLEQLIDLTQKRGVGIATATGDIDLTTDVGRMVARILAAVARAEVERKGQRQIAQNQQRVTKGRHRWSHRPFGYEKDTTFREPEAELLRRAYTDVMAGTRLATIRDRWNAASVTTTAGKPWTTQGLGKLLRDPRNCGVIRYQGGEAGKGDWPPLVDETTFGVAVARLRNSPHSGTGGAVSASGAWLVGVATCANCGGKVWTRRKSPTDDTRFYSCPKGCIHLPMEWADSRVLLAVSEILSDDGNRARWEHLATERGEQGSGLRAEHGLLVERLDNLAADYAEGLLTREQMLTGTSKVRERIAELEADLDQLGTEDGPLFDVEWFVATVDEMEPDAVRALLRSVVEVKLHRRGKGSKAGLSRDLVEVLARDAPVIAT